MATLTLKRLKTSEPISTKPVNDLIGKFAVMRHARHRSSCQFSMAHLTHEGAKLEAQRLSKLQPTERYLIVEIVEGVE